MKYGTRLYANMPLRVVCEKMGTEVSITIETVEKPLQLVTSAPHQVWDRRHRESISVCKDWVPSYARTGWKP